MIFFQRNLNENEMKIPNFDIATNQGLQVSLKLELVDHREQVLSRA